jgi:hypothetical protein
LTGFCNWRAVGKLCSDVYLQPVFTRRTNRYGRTLGLKGRRGSGGTTLGSKLGGKMNIINEIFYAFNKF